MAALSLNPRPDIHAGKNHHQHGAVVEEIEGLIRVYKDGHVERPTLIPSVPCNVPSELKLTVRDIVVGRFTNLWVRVYVPHGQGKLPFLVYFHGGGFCVGSAAWSCYHDFLANLASKAGCVVMSVNYRLAPENCLPAAYDDGFRTVMWVKEQAAASSSKHMWWLSCCNLSCFFLAGDSAGANIAHNVALKFGSSNAANPSKTGLTQSIPDFTPGIKQRDYDMYPIRTTSLSNRKATESTILKPLCHRGTILIQPFFGGEIRTASERAPQPPGSALTLSASDVYWRLALPASSNREHPWCNPLINGAAHQLRSTALPATMVCVSDMDILMERNTEFCSTMVNAGKAVQMVVYKGVGHAFQILNNSPLSKARTQEMMTHLKSFINK